MSYATDKSVVTSLEPEEGSRITVENCDGEPATTGALKIDLDLGLAVIDSALEGFQVIKDVTSHEYQRGPIVEGIFQGTGAISLSSTAQLDVSGDTLHQGRITLTSDLEVTGRELMPQIVRLNDVIERYFEEVPYLGFASGRESSVRFRFHLPPGDLGASPKIKLRAIIIGRDGPTFPQALPGLTMTYRLIARPTSPTALPTTDTSLTFDPTSVTMTALNEYAEVESSNIDPVAAGDTLLIEITRSASDGYAGEVGIMRLGAIFV